MKCTLRRVVYLLSLVSFFLGFSNAQVATGVLPFNSYGGGPFDTLNLGNLNVHFSIPVLHKAGRGTPFTYDLSFENSLWKPVTSGGTTSWQPSTTFGWSGLGEYQAGTLTSQVTTGSGPCNPPSNMTMQYWTIYYNWVYQDAQGTKHPFSIASSTGGLAGCTVGPPASSTGVATDGSGYTLAASGGSGTLYSAAGKTLNVPVNLAGGSSTTTDTNGNKITTNTSGVITDTLGQTVLTIAGGAPSNLTFTYTPPSGVAKAVTVSYATYTVKTNFACGITEYNVSNVSLVDRVTLADGSFYQFTYEQTPGGATGQVTGRVAQVTLPTGGTITYGYDPFTDGHHGIICSDGTTDGLTRIVNGAVWTYKRSQISGNHWQTKVTTPPDPQNSGSASDDTVIDFMKDSATPTNGFNTGSFYETQRQAYQGTSTSGTLLLTTTKCWNNNTSCTTAAIASPIWKCSVTLQFPGGLQSKTTTSYNGYGLPTLIDQTSYTPGAGLQSTQISYATLGNNIFDHPASIIIYDATSHVLSSTVYTYDEYSTYPLQTTPSTPQHGSITGSRGNLTTVARKVIGSTYLYQHFAYYDTGNVYRSYDVNGAFTTYNYDTTAQGTTTNSCGNSFPTSVTLPISGLSTSVSYDCVGGVARGAIDLNGNSSTTDYSDLYFWRPASLTAPYTPSVNTTTNFYYIKFDPSTGKLANSESKMVFNGSSVLDQLTTFGLYGQPLYSQQREGSSSANYDSTQVLYDSFLRVYQNTMPCVATSTTFTGQGAACPSSANTTSTYDALGRVTKTTDGGSGYISTTYNQNDVKQAIGPFPSGESLKQKQLEYDAIGRLTSVCEITSMTGYVACGQTNSNNGFFTTYAYGVNGSGYPTMTVTQGPAGSQQTRVYTYDLLGRLISETNPENGTTTYTYDSDSAGNCSGTYTGDLVKLTDAKGNKICYQYDQIHRKTQISYPSGPDAANTSAKTLVYDTATFNGTAMSNPKGHLVEAYTGSSGSKTTDEFFSYSVRGELLDTWQCTPHSGTGGCSSVSNYYHVTVGFFENGALKTLSSSISGLPTQNYTVDAMGRTSTVSASAGQNPVTGTNYNLSAFTSSVTFGSGDSDTFYQDANTGRQTKYVFNVNGATNTGQTNWNQNGSLGSLQIADNISGTSDTQTCNYTHDDLSRIASVNCANGATAKWNQSFTYDRFGNVKKATSGPGISFLPFYTGDAGTSTSPSNQLYQIGSGSTGATNYQDLNGQVTYDGTHNYTWDAEHNMVSVDANPANCSTSGQCLIYDGLGRMVEKTSGSTYTQIVYGPQGRFASMNGQAPLEALVSVPGAQVVYTSASLSTTNKIAYYRHADHLGSSRLATTSTGTLYSSTSYAPYGEPYAQTGTTDLSFTGQEQDTVPVTTNGLLPAMYDFLMRKQSPVQGRWLSPDPAGIAAVDPANPQSWNRYAYVLNNPLAMVDPYGLCGGGVGEYGAPCQAFSFPTPSGCVVHVSYYQAVGDDGYWYDMPIFTIDCTNRTSCQDGVTCGPPNGGSEGGSETNSKPSRPPDCRYVDPLFAGLEAKVKYGAEIEIFDLDIGFSPFVKTVGEDGVTSEGTVGYKGLLSFQRKYDSPTASPDDSFTIFGFHKDLGKTPWFSLSGWTFQPSKEFKIGAQALLGGEIGWNSDKVAETAKHNQECGYYDHH